MSELRSLPTSERGATASSVLDLSHGSQGGGASLDTSDRRLEFLTRVSTVLGATLDYETTLADLAQLAVPFLADWCIVYLADEGDAVRRAAVTFADPDQAPIAEELQHFLGPDPNGKHAAIEAVRSGQPVTFPVLSDLILQAVARSDAHFATLKKMGLRSSVCVPLIVQGQVVGSLLFMTAGSGRVYGPEDVRLAQDLAARAALAMENARLYREAQDARRKVEELNERLQQAMVETHHRVKNNLQIIAAMIDARLMDDGDPVSERDFRRLASNVRALSSVHDTLTHRVRAEGEIEKFSAREVLGRLIPLIQQTTPTSSLTLEVDDVYLTSRQGTSLALVVNELVSNAVKHGNQEVRIAFKCAAGACTLRVSDDGKGFAPNFDPKSSANTGLALVDTLCRWDLAGDVSFANAPEGGAVVTVTFPFAH
jgi:two-component sensor histidine kinase